MAARGFVDASRFHPYEPVFHKVHAADPVLPTDLVEILENTGRAHTPGVNGNRVSFFIIDFDNFGLVGSILRIYGHDEHLRVGLRPRIFENAALVTYMQHVAVAAIRLGLGNRNRYPVLFCKRNKVASRLHIPFPPGRDHLYVRSERHVSQLEAHLVVSLPCGSVAHRVSPFFLGYPDLVPGDQRAGNRCAEQVLTFVDGVGSKCRKNELACELLPQVFNARFDRAGREGFFFDPVQFLILAQVGREGYNLASIGLNEPLEDNRSIKSA